MSKDKCGVPSPMKTRKNQQLLLGHAITHGRPYQSSVGIVKAKCEHDRLVPIMKKRGMKHMSPFKPKVKRKGQGWRQEKERHAMAARGIQTSKQYADVEDKRYNPPPTYMTFDGKVYTQHDQRTTKMEAEQITRRLKKKGMLVRINERISPYSGKTLYVIYTRRG